MIFSQAANMLNPDVSVIIPTYNRISMLEEALASVFFQEFEGVVEIIVVDDNSQDGTSEIISQKYPNIHLISLKENVGSYGARNRGLLAAQGKYIALLDSDDLWEKNYLKSQITTLAGKERCFSVSAIVIWDTVKDQKIIKLQKPNLEKFTSPIHNLLAGWSFIGTPSSVVFPRQVFDQVGLFDETYKVGGDNDLYTRCLIAGYQPIFTELAVVIYRKHNQGQLTDGRNLTLSKKYRLMRIEKIYPSIKNKFDLAPIRHLRAEIHAHFASRYFDNKYFGLWLMSSIESAYNASFVYALLNMMRDLKRKLRTTVFSLQK